MFFKGSSDFDTCFFINAMDYSRIHFSTSSNTLHLRVCNEKYVIFEISRNSYNFLVSNNVYINEIYKNFNNDPSFLALTTRREESQVSALSRTN